MYCRIPGPGVGVFEEREILQWTLLLFNVCKSLARVFCNLAKASLRFGGATNSEFAEFLLHLPGRSITAREISLVLTKPSLTCRRQSHPSCVSISFLEVWSQMNAVRSILKLARLQNNRPI